MMLHKIWMIVYLVFLLILTSCSEGKSVEFEFENYKFEYIYKSQPVHKDQFLIDRKVKITMNSTKKSLNFELLEDIENLDEARFFQVNSIKYNGVEYSNILLIRDPFAFAIVDLNNLKILYNSHGEDDILERIKIESNENCIGKVVNEKFIPNNCTMEFNFR